MFNFLLVGIMFGLLVFLSILWRKVVPPNQVHIVNRRKKSTSYGNEMEAGNVYWNIPQWIPIWGVVVAVLPTTVFDLDLKGYQAYDQQKVPFVVDVIAFFQIENPVIAARRIESLDELNQQLRDMLQGIVRKILASYDVRKIMETRSELSEQFIAEVRKQVADWGVKANNIEFTDIRDESSGEGAHRVIADIMEKKTSVIERERRVEVAENMKLSEVAEIENKKEAKLVDVVALEEVEKRDAERTQTVGVAQETAKQEVQAQARITTEIEIAVAREKEVGTANYQKEQVVVQAEAAADKRKIEAEGYKEAQIRMGDGNAQKTNLEGTAEAEVIRKKLLAEAEGEMKRAEAMKKLQEAKKIELGKLAIQAQKEIGIAVAKAYEKADIKAYLSNGAGIDGLKDLFTTGGGQKLAAFFDTFKDVGGVKGLSEIWKGAQEDSDEETPANDTGDTEKRSVTPIKPSSTPKK